MMARVHSLVAFLRRQHAIYLQRHAAHRVRMLYDQYSNASRDLSAALFAEKLAQNKLESLGLQACAPAKKPMSDHDVRRITWLEIVAIYGCFIGLCLWNWW